LSFTAFFIFEQQQHCVHEPAETIRLARRLPWSISTPSLAMSPSSTMATPSSRVLGNPSSQRRELLPERHQLPSSTWRYRWLRPRYLVRRTMPDL
jgi:hypothetical protein